MGARLTTKKGEAGGLDKKSGQVEWREK